jgi:hypothetical protein
VNEFSNGVKLEKHDLNHPFSCWRSAMLWRAGRFPSTSSFDVLGLDPSIHRPGLA